MSEVIREAASVVAVRDAVAAPEVLVIERSGAARFLPGYVAFPGGAVDRRDEELAERWFGDRSEAARACAVRELVEEVGLRPGDSGLEAARRRGLDGIRLQPARLRRMARWVAPPDVPVRFDAQFFAIDAGGAPDPAPDGEEAAAAWWISPRRLLDDWRAGAYRLYWPTYFTVRTLARCASAEELLALTFETREPDEDELAGLPRSVFWQGGA